MAGIGLNVNQTVFRSDAPKSRLTGQITGREHDLSLITGELIRLLDSRYAMIISGMTAELAEEYQDALYRCGEWHRYCGPQRRVRRND